MAYKAEYSKEHTFDEAAIDNGEVGDFINSVLQAEKDNADVDNADTAFHLDVSTEETLDEETGETTTTTTKEAKVSVAMHKQAGEGPDFTSAHDALTQAVADEGIETAQSNAADASKIVENG